jgi:hypothetical protein
MQRRKLIVGTGALVAGSATGIGTSAFTSVKADRQVSVAVENDADAYLGLEALDNADADQYVKESNGTLEIDIGDGDNGGSGINLNAKTEYDSLFRVTNRGTQTALFFIQYDPDDGQDGFLDGAEVNQNDPSGEQSLEFFREDDGFVLSFPDGTKANAAGITSGGNVDVGLRIDTGGLDGSELDTQAALFNGSVTITVIGSE